MAAVSIPTPLLILVAIGLNAAALSIFGWLLFRYKARLQQRYLRRPQAIQQSCARLRCLVSNLGKRSEDLETELVELNRRMDRLATGVDVSTQGIVLQFSSLVQEFCAELEEGSRRLREEEHRLRDEGIEPPGGAVVAVESRATSRRQEQTTPSAHVPPAAPSPTSSSADIAAVQPEPIRTAESQRAAETSGRTTLRAVPVRGLECISDIVRAIQRNREERKVQRERRSHPRHAATVPLVVTPLDDQLRAAGESFDGTLRDISVSGLSFLISRAIDARWLLIKLQIPGGGVRHVHLEVARCDAVGRFYVVGGRFAGQPPSVR